MNSWERTVRAVLDDDLFVAFYAGMDAYVDWVLETVPEAQTHGFVSIRSAARHFKAWRVLVESSEYENT